MRREQPERHGPERARWQLRCRTWLRERPATRPCVLTLHLRKPPGFPRLATLALVQRVQPRMAAQQILWC